MNSKSKRLLAVARLAALREQQQLARASAARAAMERQLGAYDQLEAYRKDHLGASRQGIHAVSSLANATRFLQDIASAARVQEARLDAAQQAWRVEQSGWEQLHAKRQRLEDWVAQAKKEEDRQREKSQQQDAEESWLAQHQPGRQR